MDFLNSSKKENRDADSVFGQSIAFSLRNVTDQRKKEYAKIKIQEIIYQAHFGNFGLSSFTNFTQPPQQTYRYDLASQETPNQYPLSPLSSLQQVQSKTPLPSPVLSQEASPTIPHNYHSALYNEQSF